MATARSDATAHRLARIAFMAKYAQAMPIVRNAAAGIANTVNMFSPLRRAYIDVKRPATGRLGKLSLTETRPRRDLPAQRLSHRPDEPDFI